MPVISRRLRLLALLILLGLGTMTALVQRSGRAGAAQVPTLKGVSEQQLAYVNITLGPPSGPSNITAKDAAAVAESSWHGNAVIDAQQATCTISGSDIANDRPCWVVTTDPGDDHITLFPTPLQMADGQESPTSWPVAFQVTLVDANTGELIWAQEAGANKS
jgi:hypothetical protein